MYSHAYWLARDHAEAEDLVQEALAKALRGFASFAVGTNFKAWIFRILRNAFLTSRTGLAAMRTEALEDQAEGFEAAAAGPTPEELLIRADDEAALYAAMEQLAAPLREVLLLCDVEEMKYREIAFVLEVPVGTVMSRLSRARRGAAAAADGGVWEIKMTHLDEQTVNAYVDGESVEEAAVRAHLAECHECALRVIAATRLKRAVGRLRVAMPAGAMDRLAGRLEPKRSFGYGWMALAAVLVLAIAMGAWAWSRSGSGLAAELLDEHLTTLSAAAAPEVLSTDRHTVKPWFQGKLPFSFNLPETLPADTTLVGGGSGLCGRAAGGSAAVYDSQAQGDGAGDAASSAGAAAADAGGIQSAPCRRGGAGGVCGERRECGGVGGVDGGGGEGAGGRVEGGVMGARAGRNPRAIRHPDPAGCCQLGGGFCALEGCFLRWGPCAASSTPCGRSVRSFSATATFTNSFRVAPSSAQICLTFPRTDSKRWMLSSPSRCSSCTSIVASLSHSK